ncbi:16S rRNA (uracil(1498)-N(3))-methyltransferase [Brachybacterium saurashtrense]|uniref:Ribosomal RNA small subunit methyltransferase E n=1 Tax=Brachybacterium saurashtrense TaxID=556288 RepID=A0A345YMR5_9MICO|nr:16S rRNA (uracil(1498)-N(3))-methyltransferase [Brachybacterium saurashtrense]AXK45217.1 16S rRNA (uracil(1498)-N(3))-methyltransferase [Brachybacterium saurashtrense]RRR22029.1 16S rRNA (uracil(1498)-N(3))-methyltransferase [Brachybacterium saurashtrense]
MPTTPPGFLILDDALATAREGDALTLGGDEGRHAAKVARIGAGEQVLLTDAPGRQVRAEVTAARKEALELRLLGDPSPAVQRLPRLGLVQALATGGRDEQAVESATELGVDRIVPWSARRSVSVWRGEKLRKGRAKWEATVRAAVKQCRRPGIPAVDAPVDTAQLAAHVRERTAQGALVLVLHEQESVGVMELAGALRGASADGVEEILVVVGPEGGIAADELEALRDAGARTVLLGPEVLRTSSAGPAALAVLSALVGRWG